MMLNTYILFLFFTYFRSSNQDYDYGIIGGKDDCYMAIDKDGRKRYQCKICRQTLSSQQRVRLHLISKHDKSKLLSF